MNKKNNKLDLGLYLQNVDLVNKYCLKSLNQAPKIKKIYIQAFLKDFVEATDFVTSKKASDDIKLKASMFFYILLNQRPTVRFQSIKTTKSSKTMNDGDFVISCGITGQEQINELLEYLGNTNYLKSNFKILTSKQVPKDGIFSYNLKIPGNAFFEINDFFNAYFPNINLKRLSLDISIVFENLPNNASLTPTVKQTLNLCAFK